MSADDFFSFTFHFWQIWSRIFLHVDGRVLATTKFQFCSFILSLSKTLLLHFLLKHNACIIFIPDKKMVGLKNSKLCGRILDVINQMVYILCKSSHQRNKNIEWNSFSVRLVYKIPAAYTPNFLLKWTLPFTEQKWDDAYDSFFQKIGRLMNSSITKYRL